MQKKEADIYFTGFPSSGQNRLIEQLEEASAFTQRQSWQAQTNDLPHMDLPSVIAEVSVATL